MPIKIDLLANERADENLMSGAITETSSVIADSINLTIVPCERNHYVENRVSNKTNDGVNG